MKTIDDAECITVRLGKRAYDILVSFHWSAQIGKVLRERGLGGRDVMVFTSPTIGALYFTSIETPLKKAGFVRVVRHDIPDGEKNKNLKEYKKCLDALMKNFPNPGTVPLVVNLGGGVVSDTGGFVAATFRRGVPYLQVPTTLLGCVDCGVGGKVGVNHNEVKNIVGAFYQPRLVFADLAFLKTVPLREIRSGIAEVIKYGVVCKAAFFEYLEQEMDRLLALEPQVLKHVVSECYRIKAQVVEEDEQDDRDRRVVLNFGHTIGHALEMAAASRMTHGEAISIGMMGAIQLSRKLGLCQEDLYDRVKKLLERAGLPTSAEKYRVAISQVLQSISYDKKSRGGVLRFVLPTAIGAWRVQGIEDPALLREIVRG